ncbi:MAG: hypothetical protein GX326_01455 [Clostridiaceae bacterium]|nr:hypothetical protein [Clostridiaceae bacterium]
MELKLLMKNKEVEVYIGNYDLTWLDSSLYIKYKEKEKEKEKAITLPSGEIENDVGTFFLATYNLSDEESEYANQVMKAIADPETIKEIPFADSILTEFTLKEPYLSKVIALDMRM